MCINKIVHTYYRGETTCRLENEHKAASNEFSLYSQQYTKYAYSKRFSLGQNKCVIIIASNTAQKTSSSTIRDLFWTQSKLFSFSVKIYYNTHRRAGLFSRNYKLKTRMGRLKLHIYIFLMCSWRASPQMQPLPHAQLDFL